jgi:hypothetical protein
MRPQQCLNFLPDPQAHGEFRPAGGTDALWFAGKRIVVGFGGAVSGAAAAETLTVDWKRFRKASCLIVSIRSENRS